MKKFAAAALAAALMCGTAMATDLEVTHWWVSGGEAAAVAELAKAFDAEGDHWVDGAIAGSGSTANPIIISRILGGNPMGATQMNTGRDAEELIQAGLMQDLSEVATAEHWADVIRPASVFAPCQVDGKVYCVPVNIHSNNWLWLNRHVFLDNGLEVPTTWDQFVDSFPALKDKGIIPLSMGPAWTVTHAWNQIFVDIAGPEVQQEIYRDKSVDAVRSDDFKAALQAFADVRDSFDPATQTGLWNEATNLVITGQAAGNIMGDWAQGEFAVAGKVAGEDYDCLPGLGVRELVDTGGDSFYFPKNEDPEITAAQLRLAKLLLSPDVQVAFNLKKGSTPVRGDVDTSTANACMQKALKLFADPTKVLPASESQLTSDTQQQIEDLISEFFSDHSITVDDAQNRFADIIASAQ
ncbi:ABC transporter substrate-binding protein [Devosia sp. 2618]|uniref:ABC transporter substrate-binding protein n=1 Tax=Devosia sp. 2618 TaxID=3156454 RepID=UPI003393CE91